VTPHIAANDTRRGGSTVDGRTTRHAGYELSQVVRKRIEEHFGWGKTVGRIRQTVFRGLRRVDQHFKLTVTASNLVRMARMPIAVPQGSNAMSPNRPRNELLAGCPEALAAQGDAHVRFRMTIALAASVEILPISTAC
jgi:hypothetical protein